MDARLQRRVQRYGWDKAAADYEQSWQRQLAPAQSALLAMAALEPGQRVLDVACGTGLVTFAAADAVAPSAGARPGRIPSPTSGASAASAGSAAGVISGCAAVMGVDISEGMVTLARARARARGLDDRVRFDRMDAEQLDLPSSSFDVALCALGLMYVPDVLAAVREMARVLVPGGRMVAAVWGQRARCGWADVFPIVDAHVRSDVCPLFFAPGTGNQLAATFESAGLTDVVTQRIESRLEWSSAGEACGAVFIGGPVALAYSRFDDSARTIVHDQYLRSIEPYRHGDGYAVPGEFVIVSGRRSGH